MKVERQCEPLKINWALLPDLEAKLERLGFGPSKHLPPASVTLQRFPTSMTFDTTEAASQNVREAGPPQVYSVDLRRVGEGGELYVHFANWAGYPTLSVEGKGATLALFDALADLLSLQPAEPEAPHSQPRLERTVFIAHRFDDLGRALADKLARFLELLGFSVKSGHAYAPKSVAEKVRERLSAQAIIIVILTAGLDDTWLVQESVLADTKGKSLFLLKAQDATFKSGVLADHEYIPFDPPNIEVTFVGILEGLREVGYGFRRSTDR